MQQCNKTMQIMINFNDVVKENIQEHSPIWPKTTNQLYRLLIQSINNINI